MGLDGYFAEGKPQAAAPRKARSPEGILAQKGPDQFKIELVIFHRQNDLPLHGCACSSPTREIGIRNRKALPFPNPSLSAQTFPPCISTNWRLKVVPNPVP